MQVVTLDNFLISPKQTGYAFISRLGINDDIYNLESKIERNQLISLLLKFEDYIDFTKVIIYDSLVEASEGRAFPPYLVNPFYWAYAGKDDTQNYNKYLNEVSASRSFYDADDCLHFLVTHCPLEIQTPSGTDSYANVVANIKHISSFLDKVNVATFYGQRSLAHAQMFINSINEIWLL